MPEGIREELRDIGLWDLHPRNLFRISWKNEPVETGGGFDGVNFIELPSELTGVEARILMLVGKYFPDRRPQGRRDLRPAGGKAGARHLRPDHPEGAVALDRQLLPRRRLRRGHLLACPSIAVLPEGMSRERFEWLEEVGSEIYATPGSESNVKEIYDKTKELKAEHPDEIVVLNQFEEFGNAIWHYVCTGRAMEEVFEAEREADSRFAGVCLTQGSAGTLGCADYLREVFPGSRWWRPRRCSARPCSYNGYGSHRIEGIGDKHVPWIHNIKNTDVVAGIDDEACMRLLRLFNEPDGRAYLKGAVSIPISSTGSTSSASRRSPTC